jgi:hypothetical protein
MASHGSGDFQDAVNNTQTAALGFRVKSGWAAVVLLTNTVDAASIRHRPHRVVRSAAARNTTAVSRGDGKTRDGSPPKSPNVSVWSGMFHDRHLQSLLNVIRKNNFRSSGLNLWSGGGSIRPLLGSPYPGACPGRPLVSVGTRGRLARS